MKREKELKIGINWGKKCNLKKKKKKKYMKQKRKFSLSNEWFLRVIFQRLDTSFSPYKVKKIQKKTNTVLFSSREYNYIKNTLQYSLRFIQVRNHWIKDLAMIAIHVEILNNNIFNANSFRDRAW